MSLLDEGIVELMSVWEQKMEVYVNTWSLTKADAALCCGSAFSPAQTEKMVRDDGMIDWAKYRVILEESLLKVAKRFETGVEAQLPAGQIP